MTTNEIVDPTILDLKATPVADTQLLVCATCKHRPYVDAVNQIAWCKKCASNGYIVAVDATYEFAAKIEEPEPVSEIINDTDNIDDADLTEEQIAQLVRDMQQVADQTVKTPSVADLYMLQA